MPASSPDILTINAGKPTITLTVTNTSDHPVQITSHMPFWEINLSYAVLGDQRAYAV